MSEHTNLASPQATAGAPSDPHLMFVNGNWVPARDGAVFERFSPTNGELVARYADGAAGDAEDAILAARAAFDGPWPHLAARERTRMLRDAAARLYDDLENVARSISAEVGKPLAISRGEVAKAAETFEYFAFLAMDDRGQAVDRQRSDALGLILREPVGVVGVITPWNYPLILLAWKLAPALAVGCTTVVKPSHLASGSTLLLAHHLHEAGLPAGAVNVVPSARERGAIVGETMVRSPLVDKIAFTGSTATGKRVMAMAADTVKRVSLELGGKSPNLVFPDAPLEAAARGAFDAIYTNSGQVCQAGSRLLVHAKVHDELLDRLLAHTKNDIVLGDPFDAHTTMGPVVDEQQLQRVLELIDAGRSSATLLTGGGRSNESGHERGLFVQPTIFDDVPPSARIAQEEVFGPVLSVLQFSSAEEAIRIANATMYGLAAAVWTRDLTTAITMAKGIRAGSVYVNCYNNSGLSQMPFGGFGQSGMGREQGHQGLDEYLETKSVHIRLV